MPDNRSKRPLPTVMDVGTFQRRFGTDEACWEHLRSIRWGPNLERFTCPDCGHATGWWLANRRLVECTECHHQTLVTADLKRLKKWTTRDAEVALKKCRREVEARWSELVAEPLGRFRTLRQTSE